MTYFSLYPSRQKKKALSYHLRTSIRLGVKVFPPTTSDEAWAQAI